MAQSPETISIVAPAHYGKQNMRSSMHNGGNNCMLVAAVNCVHKQLVAMPQNSDPCTLLTQTVPIRRGNNMSVVHGYVSSGPCTPPGQIQTREKKQNITEAKSRAITPANCSATKAHVCPACNQIAF